MSRIAVIGGTGYAGSNIVAEAARRGHEVVSVSRKAPENPAPGVRYVEGSVLDTAAILSAVGDVDAIVVALSPRGDMVGKVRPAIAELFAAMPGAVRLAIVGGAGGSLVAPGGPRLVDGDFTEEYKPEALEMAAVLDDLQADTSGKDWFLIHPAGGFGAWNPGERTGSYRDGGDVLVVDEAGESFISGADLGVAFIDEIENPKHPRGRFTVGY